MTVKLTKEQAEYIRLFKDIAKPAALAEEYGVCVATIYNVLNGVSFREDKKPRKDRALSEDTVREIRQLQAEGLSDWKISRRPGMPPRSSVRQVLNGKSYRDVV